MSPTVFIKSGYRFLFFSREETRMHVHVQHVNGEAKFWLEPEIKLAQNYGLNKQRISMSLKIIKEHENEIRAAWKKHFGH
jgi:hypothetical protein